MVKSAPLPVHPAWHYIHSMSTVVITLSAAEIRQEADAIKKAGKEIRKDRATTLAFLQKHGFVTKSGKLTKRYGG